MIASRASSMASSRVSPAEKQPGRSGTTTPKAIAYDAFATQEGNATDVSAVTLYIKFIFTK